MACKQVTLQVNDGRIGIHTNSVLVTTGINAQSVVPLFVTPVFKEFIATSINAANTDIPVGARIWKFNGRRLFTAQDATEKLPGTEVTVDFLPPATSSVVHESILDFHILHACVHDFFEQYDREKVPTAAVFAGPHVGDSSNICMALIQACPHAPITDQTLQYLKYFSSLQQISRYTATTINTSQPKTEAPEQLDLSVYQGLLRRRQLEIGERAGFTKADDGNWTKTFKLYSVATTMCCCVPCLAPPLVLTFNDGTRTFTLRKGSGEPTEYNYSDIKCTSARYTRIRINDIPCTNVFITLNDNRLVPLGGIKSFDTAIVAQNFDAFISARQLAAVAGTASVA